MHAPADLSAGQKVSDRDHDAALSGLKGIQSLPVDLNDELAVQESVAVLADPLRLGQVQ